MSNQTKLYTVEDAGFGKVCPRKFPKAANLKNVIELGGYEVLEGDEFLYCKPVPLNTKLIALEATIFKDNSLRWRDILASFNFLYKAELPPEVPQFTIKETDVDKLLERFSERPMPASLHAFTSLLFWPMPGELQKVLEKAVPKFFEKYPNGRLHFVRVSKILEAMQSVCRVLTAIDTFGLEVFEDPKIREQYPAGLLSRIHPRTIHPIPESYIKTLLSCFYKYIHGACVARVGGMIIVQIDPPCEFELPYIRDRWDFNRLRGMFEPNDKFDFVKYLETMTMTDEQKRIAYKRYVFPSPAWTAQEFDDLLKWTIERINNFLIFTLDLCNYTNEGRFIDFIKQRKIVLTLERIITEINYIVTEIDPFMRKTLYFNLHDKIATLPDPTVNMSKRRTIFNRLLKQTHYAAVLRDRLTKLPAPFNTKIPLLGDALFEDVIERSIESIWAQYRVSRKGIRTRQTTRSVNGYITQKMKDKLDLYVREDFVVNFLHEIRNSLHGYQLQGGGFEEFLLMHSGDVPDNIADLSLVWYFLLLADIQGLISGEWTKGVSPKQMRQ